MLLAEKTKVWDTTFVTKERIVSDTIWVNKDTTIVQDSVIIRYQVLSNGMAHISAICPPERIKIEKEFVTQYVNAPKKGIPFSLIAWIVILLLGAYIMQVIASIHGHN